jgi:RNA polymerase sigma factor (sigma-70 family)
MLSQTDRDKLLYEHVILARSLARRYRNMGVERDDLVQEAFLGFLAALETFNESLGSFATHARPYAVSRITRAIRYAGETTIPPRISKAARRCDRIRQALVAAGNPRPTFAQIAEHTGYQESDVELALCLPRGRKPGAVAELPAAEPDASDERALAELWSAAEILDPYDRELLADRYGCDGRPPQGMYEICSRRSLSMAFLRKKLDLIRKVLRLELVKRGFNPTAVQAQENQSQLNTG